MYFTDPPYGLAKQDGDPAKELQFNGVFRLTAAGKLEVLVKDLTRPNGLAFSPDEKKLYVANSDPGYKIWMVYDVKADGTSGQREGLLRRHQADRRRPAGRDEGGHQGQPVLHRSRRNLGVFAARRSTSGSSRRPRRRPIAAGVTPTAKTLYITARTGLYRVKLSIQGIRP